ncbi:hypothetical protein [Methylobacterium nodulans]|uniref:hypothetical protein n=1 Tax=Methylobacterium nodulans TaxID=114616 RepID=UPI0012ECF7B6|nr:hypothetical protein [Methylobacterium nodulans]
MQQELLYRAFYIRHECGMFITEEAVIGPLAFEMTSSDISRIQRAIDELWFSIRHDSTGPSWLVPALVEHNQTRIDLDGIVLDTELRQSVHY